MHDKKKQPTSLPASDSKNISELSFEELKQKFEASDCEKDSFAIATHMYAKDFHKAMTLLPLNFDVFRPTEAEATQAIEKIDPKRLDFNGDASTSRHEWASALVAAKKLKIGAGVALEVDKVDQVVDQAQKIYLQTRKEEPLCRPI